MIDWIGFRDATLEDKLPDRDGSTASYRLGSSRIHVDQRSMQHPSFRAGGERHQSRDIGRLADAGDVRFLDVFSLGRGYGDVALGREGSQSGLKAGRADGPRIDRVYLNAVANPRLRHGFGEGKQGG